MGLFGLLSSGEEKRKEEVRTGARAPDRSERKVCWEARDNFYKCLDKHEVIDSLTGEGKKTADTHCAQEDKAFQENCASAWVSELLCTHLLTFGRGFFLFLLRCFALLTENR
ncbi:oxidoreductase-like protein [Xylariaceae sp. FL0594]|nr:oxidoreductase-like protein [Xylariaceae sp. FL0594]